jgi:hypothetical protein
MEFELPFVSNYAAQIMTLQNTLKQDFAGDYILIKFFLKDN